MKLIGWVPVDDEGNPVRPHRSGYAWQTNLTSPPRVYTTKGRAEGYHGGNARPVYIGDEE